MCSRKSEGLDYSLSNYNTFYLILEELRKWFLTKEIWLVEEGGSKTKRYDENIEIYNIFAYDHFGEVIDILKPDLVISIGGDYEYLERSMLKAAESKGIPSVDITSTVIEQGYFTRSYSKGIFSGRIHAIKDHGKNIIRKYIFLIRTLYHTKYNLFYIIRTFITDLYLPFTTFVPRYNFGGGALNIVSTPSWVDFLVKKGIDRNKIAVTGECSMDPMFYKIEKMKLLDKKNHKIPGESFKMNILFITTQMVEHGYWKPSMRDHVVKTVIAGIIKEFGKTAQIKIKIHPVSESILTYRHLLKDTGPNIEIIQVADLAALILESHIVVGFGITSAFMQAFLLRKPIFLMNLFNEDPCKNIYLREKIAVECKDNEELINHIRTCTKNKDPNQKTDEFYEKIIEKIFFRFDGKCSERAANEIVKLISKYRGIRNLKEDN